MCCSRGEIENLAQNGPGVWADSQAVTGKVIAIEVGGIDMHEVAFCQFLVTAGRYTLHHSGSPFEQQVTGQNWKIS